MHLLENKKLKCASIECSFRRNGSARNARMRSRTNHKIAWRGQMNQGESANRRGRVHPLLDLWFYFRLRIINSCLQRRRLCFPREKRILAQLKSSLFIGGDEKKPLRENTSRVQCKSCVKEILTIVPSTFLFNRKYKGALSI